VLIWTSIEKSFEDTNIVWFNKFLRHHWFSQKGYVSNGNLFREIKLGLINKDGVSVETLFEYLNELKRDSALYISFRTANLNKSDFSLTIRGEAWSNVERINNFIKNLGLDQVYSVLLSLYKYGNKESEYFNNGENVSVSHKETLVLSVNCEIYKS
jgi:hypothetical protein